MAQSNDQPFNDNKSIIRDSGFFVRREYRQNCVFNDRTIGHGGMGMSVPLKDPYVDQQWICTIPTTVPSLPRHPNKWYLTIRTYLQLLRTGRGQYNDATASAYVFNHLEYRDSGGHHYQPSVMEYGSHLYVDYFQQLVNMKIFRPRRTDLCMTKSKQHPIHDVLPKQRLYYNGKEWKEMTVNQLFVFNHRYKVKENTFVRWWYRFGREEKSRFLESNGSMNAFDHMMQAMGTVYCGVFVRDRARLIINEALPKNNGHSNTLVMGGVFIVMNAEFLLAFADALHERFYMRQLYDDKTRFRLQDTFPDTVHPIVLLDALPSKAETLCWCIEIDAESGLQMVFVVPINGWRFPLRIQFLDWNEGIAYVVANQKQMQLQGCYQQFLNLNQVIPNPFVPFRCTQLNMNDERPYWPHELFRTESTSGHKSGSKTGSTSAGGGKSKSSGGSKSKSSGGSKSKSKSKSSGGSKSKSKSKSSGGCKSKSKSKSSGGSKSKSKSSDGSKSKSKITSGHKSGSTSGHKSKSKSGHKSGSTSGNKSGSTSGHKSGSTSGHKSGSTSGHKSGSTTSGHKTSGGRSGTESRKRPASESRTGSAKRSGKKN